MNDIKEIKHQDRVYIYYSKDYEILRYPAKIKWSERSKNMEVIASLLSKMQSIVKDYVIKNGDEPSIEYVRNKMSEKQLGRANVFAENIDMFLEEKKLTISKASLKDFKSFQHSIMDFETAKNKKLTFDDINIKFINEYVEFLLSPIRRKDAITRGGLNDNTASKRIDVLKAYMKYIEEHELYEFPLKVHHYKPIHKYQIKIVSLSLDELRKVQKLELTGTYKMIRDIFLFCSVTSLRFSDVVSLSDDDIIEEDGEYRMVKTAKKTKRQYVQTLNDTAVQIWNEYEHNFNRISNQKFNLHLKEILRDSELFDEIITIPTWKNGIKEVKKVPKWSVITSHTGRRSAITNHISAGTTIKELMAITSHSKIETLIKYLNKGGANKDITDRIKL